MRIPDDFGKTPGKPISRRSFVRQASCAACSSIPLFSTLLNLKMAGSVAAAEPGPGEYRALVCLFLAGGNDSFNMLVPRGASEYAEYAAIRDDLALPQGSLLPINPTNVGGMQFGIHPNMPELQALFEAGNAAFVTNVGTLVEPITKAQFDNGSVPIPLGLFSHSDQIEQWQTSIPDARVGHGWAGRMGDLLKDLNSIQKVSMNISLAGSNVWQTGNTVFEYAITPGGAVGLQNYASAYNTNDTWWVVQERSAAIDGQLAQAYSNLFAQTFARSKRDSIEAYDIFSSATSGTPPWSGSLFPSDNYLADQLEMVAKCIMGRTGLGATRQTFFVQLGGWDHHDEVIASQQVMLAEVSAAVGAFYDALVTLGIQDQVTLFTASDFGRTLTSNGAGSDHAWGGNHFVVGGGVDGKKIYGQYPALYEDSALDVGRGRLIPEISVDEYFAELALWLGVSKASLPLVLPNITRFYDTGSANWPLGFLE